MKKLLAGILAAAVILPLQMPAFAIDQGARTYQITAVTGDPLNENGEQFSMGGFIKGRAYFHAQGEKFQAD